MDRYLALIKDDTLHAAVAAVRIAAEENFAVAVERTLNSRIKVVESAHTACGTGGRYGDSGHAFPFQVVIKC